MLRRAKALSLKGDHDEADEGLAAAARLEPGLAAEVERERALNQKRLRAAEAKQRKGFGGFFKGGGSGAKAVKA